MSSCFLCDCSYKFLERDKYSIVVPGDGLNPESLQRYMKQLPIMVGSSGTETDDQQHVNNKKQNYVSYRVKKIEFRWVSAPTINTSVNAEFPDYVLIFKVPFREPVFDYYFTVLQNFMLYSEPECVLGYEVTQTISLKAQEYTLKRRFDHKIEINKPFILGPNEYLGVLYMFAIPPDTYDFVNASAKVWFDIA